MRRSAVWAMGAGAVCLLAGVFLSGAGGGIASAGERADGETQGRKEVRKVRVIVPKGGKAGRGAYLGVQLEEADDPEGGALVRKVMPDSPAERAGIREGDVIVRFEDDAIRGPVGLTMKIHEAEPGSSARVTVLRDGDRETMTVDLGKREHAMVIPGDEDNVIEFPMPDTEALEDRLAELRGQVEMDEEAPGAYLRRWQLFGGKPKLGVQLVDTTSELREFLGGGEDTGVLVGKVMAGTPAEKAGVRVGDLITSVDGEDVADAGDLVRALQDKDGAKVTLEVIRDHKTVRIEAAIPDAKEDSEDDGPQAHLRWLQGTDRVAIHAAVEEAMRGAEAGLEAAGRALREVEAARKTREHTRRFVEAALAGSVL